MKSANIAKLVTVAVFIAEAFLGGQSLPNEPRRGSGAGVTGAFEGWFKNPDGSFSLLIGYFNRNQGEALDIPVGPSNHIDPLGPDQGQPTHFLPGRQPGMFVVKVPANFGKSKIEWTLTADGRTTTIPASLHPAYEIDPFREANGNTSPSLSFDEKGLSAQGPVGLSVERRTSVGMATPFTVWISDEVGGTRRSSKPGPPVVVRWTMYRGPSRVTLDRERPDVETIQSQNGGHPFRGKATVAVTFRDPGDYTLHVVVTDTGGGDSQCCYASGNVKVLVTP
jgi:hypothetical protein